MFVQLETSSIPPPREHPWTVSTANPDWKYYDFKTNCDLIPQVLEDYKRWENYQAIQTFYNFLGWLNGPESVFESNDCALGSPKEDPRPPDVIPKDCRTCISGRLTILFRDLYYNVGPTWIEWLRQTIHDDLLQNFPKFPAVVFLGYWAHYFTAIEKSGNVVTLQFWAWGVDAEQAMLNLNLLFVILSDSVREISAGVLAARVDRIRERAYFIFEGGGRQQGHDVDHWLRAEVEIAAERRRAVAEALTGMSEAETG